MRDQYKADGRITLNLTFNKRICECGLCLSDFGYEREPGFCKSGNEIKRSMKGWKIDLYKWQLLFEIN